jgi:hypothetical protein
VASSETLASEKLHRFHASGCSSVIAQRARRQRGPSVVPANKPSSTREESSSLEELSM